MIQLLIVSGSSKLLTVKVQYVNIILSYKTQNMKVQVKAGSEYHTAERRGAMVKVNGKPIYETLKPLNKPEWKPIGNKQRCTR